MIKAAEPFTFHTRFNLSELTGLKARNLEELLSLIREVPGGSIYHHTHRFLQQHEYLSPEPPNDFAFWVSSALGDDELAEHISSIDIIQCSTIRSIRERITAVIGEYVARNPSCAQRCAKKGREFYFIKSVSFVLPTPHVVDDLAAFKDALAKVSLDSIYFHMFEAKLRLEKEGNDFSNWIQHSLHDDDLAREIAKMDPYTFALEDLRKTIIKMADKRMAIHGQN